MQILKDKKKKGNRGDHEKRNSAGWKSISKSTAIVDTKN